MAWTSPSPVSPSGRRWWKKPPVKPWSNWSGRPWSRSTSIRSTPRTISRISSTWATPPGYHPSCAAPTRLCTSPNRGRCASTPVSQQRKSPTLSIVAIWPPGKKVYPSPSIWPPIAAMTPTTSAWSATSARPAWRLIRCSIWKSCSAASRSIRCRYR